MEPLVDEVNFSQQPLGPSSRSCCKVLNNNACGSGSIIGKRNGKTLVLTNAHVAGSRVGHTVTCQFPFLENQNYRARVIMAGYSDRVMMDWAVLEIDASLNLPAVKLSNKAPTGEHYTGGYPRCRGPYFQRLQTRQITHKGTVWRWQPDSIGGQSGSGVHSFADELQYGLLTWSWGGDGAGQTTKSIWFQYVNRAAIGFERPEGLIELSNRADDLENGFFAESNITTLPIWAHLDDDDGDDDDGGNGDDGGKCCPEFAKRVAKEAAELQDRAANLAELARKYSDGSCDSPADPEDPEVPVEPEDPQGPVFGL